MFIYLATSIVHTPEPEKVYILFLDRLHFLACRSRQASIVLERYFRFEMSLLSVLCMRIARTEMETSRVSGEFEIIT